MKNIFIYYDKCSTCQKAKKWLEEHHLSFEERAIKTQTPTALELEEWLKKSGKSINHFFNTSGLVYKELDLKNKRSSMSVSQQLNLLASNGMLIKRPLFISKETVLIGFHEKQWAALLKK